MTHERQSSQETQKSPTRESRAMREGELRDSELPKNQLGLKRLLGLHYYVRNLERSRRFYTELLDFAEIGASSPELTAAGRQRSLVFEAGDCAIVCSEP